MPITDTPQPSDLYPALTWGKLVALRKIVFETRQWVADDAKPERGDDRCGIGYRAWTQTRFAIVKAAINEHREWLSVKHAGAVFIFKVNMLPVRFCRADSETALPPQYRYADSDESGDLRRAAEEEGAKFPAGIFRVVTEASHTGHPVDVHLVFADTTGETVYAWKIPASLADDGTSPIVTPSKPITLGPLVVKSKAEIEAERLKGQAEGKPRISEGA